MPLKLHGSPVSTCTKRVLVTAKYLGLDVELVVVDLAKGEHKSPEFLKLQPFGQVPVLHDTDADLKVFESRAIARYLTTTSPKGHELVPKDPKQYAIVEQWLSVEAFNYDPYASKIVANIVFAKWRGQEPNVEAAQALAEPLKKTLDIYEAHLKQSKFLAGDSITLADLVHLPYTALLFVAGFGDLITRRPHVKQWWDTISGLEAWKALE